jgi:curved DNA-binding protein CbpA
MTHYQLLGVQPSASKKDIRKAYLNKARKFHPDLQTAPSVMPRQTEFSFIVRAYQTLSDEVERARYDESLVGPEDAFTVKIGPLRVSLKLLFFTSLGCLGVALATRHTEAEIAEDCPSEHKVRRLGIGQEIGVIEDKAEEPGVTWRKSAPSHQKPSLRASQKDKGIYTKTNAPLVKQTSAVKIVLPKQRSLAHKLTPAAEDRPHNESFKAV